jgi:cell wall-associated NlpC family hydrolase
MSGNNGSKSNIVTGEKITNILTTSHIESMQPTKGIENAFPTYKMYIIQSDTSDYKFSALDNYWDYRLVQDIMVVRDKDNPVHMLKARVVVDPRYVTIAPDYKFRTGVNGRLFHEEENHTQVPVRERNKEQDSNVFYKHKAPIRAGMRICIKMGYHTDPRYLDTVFIGTITQLNGSLDSGLYELSAEGDGRELTVPAVNFSDKFTGDNYSDIINAIMRVNPNVIHFGKTYGSFLRRLSYGHKTLAQLGMLGMSAVGAFGAGTVGVAVPGGIAAIAAKKTLAFSSPSLFKNIIGRGLGGGLVVAGAAGATLAATTVLPIAFGEFQQMGQWANPAFDELIARNIIETDFYQDWKGRTDKSLTVNLFGMTKDIPAIGELDGFIKGNTFNANKMSYQLTKHFYQTYKYGNNPLDDNIFAVDIFNSLTKRASLNITNKQSIWSVLQSIKMLYPNYALDIRPYGSRSTIFLGPVGFNYWRTDDPVQAILPQLNMMEGLEADAGLIDRETRRAFDANALPSTPMGDSIRNLDTKIKEGADDSRGALGLNRAPFVAFQKHHFITSDEDIIMNAIKPTPYRGWNSVIVTYGDDPNNMDPKKMVEFMADADLYPEAVIKRVIHIDFTTDPEVASRYALGFLKQGIEKLYGGTIIVKGNSKIEPYDKVYISDTVNKMYGWIQVETVIHKFDQEMGFTTHIVPNMICEINNNAYSTTQNIIMSTIYDKYIKKGAWSSVVGQFAIGGAVGLAIGAAGLSISLPVMFGLFAYQAYSAWSDYKSSFQAGKEYVGKMRDMVQADKWRNSEKILLQDIIAHSIELDAWQKGVKYGWALGYLHNRGYTKFLYKSEVTVGGMLNDSFHYFANKVKNSINMTRSALATNFGADSAVVKSWKAGQISAEAKAQMKRLAKGGSITAESTGLNEALLKETKGLWDDYHKNFKNALEKADFENAQGWLDSMKSLEEKHVTLKPEARIIPEDFDLVKKMEAAAAKAEGVQGGVASNLTKAVGKTTSAGFGGAKTVLEKIGRSGVAAWMTMGLMEFLPNLGYSFAVKAATKNNVIIVSPIYWRDNYLMPSLDGYMANDTFMHIGDMLLNVNNTLDDLNKAAHNYLPQVFPINSNIDKTTPLKGVQTVQAATSEEMNKAGELVFCILRNSGLPEIPKDFSETKWTYIAQYVKAYQVIGGANMAIFLLALLYTENRFSISGTSKKGAYGMSQIVTPGPYDRLLAKNASQTLGQTISSEMRSKLANGNFVDALQCKGYTESTLPAFINFNIKSAADISNDKWNSAYNTFYKDPNSRISKARKASTQGDVMDAVLLYGAYCGYGYNFVNDMLTGDYIKSDGTVNQSPAQKSKGFANYSSQEAIWKNNGFLSAYLALRAAYLKCSANDQNQAQKPQAKGTAVDTSMKALKQKIADYATSRVGKAFNPSNGDTSKGRAPQNRNKQNVTIDCSMFVGYVVETSTMKDRDDGRINKAIDAIIGTGRGYSSCAIMYAAGGQYTEIANAMPGDLVFFRKNSGGPVTHVEVVSRYDTSTQKWLSIGTSDAAGMIKERPISRTGFDQYEVRSYFN